MTIYKFKKSGQYFSEDRAYDKARELLTKDSPETTIDEHLRIYPSEVSEFLFSVKDELFEFLSAEVGDLANDLMEEVFEEVNVIE